MQEHSYLVQVYGGLVEKVLTDVRGYQFRVAYDGCVQRTNIYVPPPESDDVDEQAAQERIHELHYTPCTVYVIVTC